MAKCSDLDRARAAQQYRNADKGACTGPRIVLPERRPADLTGGRAVSASVMALLLLSNAAATVTALPEPQAGRALRHRLPSANSHTRNPRLSAGSMRNYQLTGRFVADPEEGVRFAWGMSSLRARFTGTAVGLSLVDAARSDTARNLFDVQVDDQPPRTISLQPHQTHIPLAHDLPPGEHTLTVIKRTEAAVGEALFSGLTLSADGALLPPPPARARRLEIVGDSISAGYGNEGDSATCSFSPETENGAQAYGPVAARLLDADVHVLAWSGKGVHRNCPPDDSETLPQLYERALPARADSAWDTADWRPDAIVVNLGTNDFCLSAPDADRFIGAYADFVRRLRNRAPNAAIFCALGSMMNDDHPAGANHLSLARSYLQQAVASLHDSNTHFLEFAPQREASGIGCDWHPSLATHALMGEQLAATLSTTLGWEYTPQPTPAVQRLGRRPGDFGVSPLFADHTVLNHRNASVFGWGIPGDRIRVRLTEPGIEAHASVADGRWVANLGELPAGGPYTLQIQGPKRTVFSNVMAGDVWMLAGQSNLDLALQEIAQGEGWFGSFSQT